MYLEKKIIGFLRLRTTSRPGMMRQNTPKNEYEYAPVNTYSEQYSCPPNSEDTCVFPELKECSLIRELHVYGQLTPTRRSNTTSRTQHRGYGKKMLAEAEYISVQRGYRKIAVIAGVGTRQYYRKYGFVLRGQGAYMIKQISTMRYYLLYAWYIMNSILECIFLLLLVRKNKIQL